MRRRFVSVPAITALLGMTALTGCASQQPSESDCEPLVTPGALSQSVQISGDSAQTLSVTTDDISAPLTAQRTLITSSEDHGDPIQEGSIASANFAYVNAVSGEVLQVSSSFGTGSGDSLFLANAEAGTIIASLFCAVPGDTIAIALSGDESAQMGVTDGSLVVVAEVTGVYGSRAAGSLHALPSGYPAVTTDDTGRPGIVLPPQSAPSSDEELQSAVRIEGSGPVVEAEDTVVGQVLTVSWSGESLRNTWETGPESFGKESEIDLSGAWYRSALTGVPVGSQVVIIDEIGDEPRVSVVDILAVA